MSAVDAKRLLLLLRQPPYASRLARTAIDTCLAAAAFEQPVQVLFQGDGVLQLLEGQDGNTLGTPTLSRIIDSFALYDIDTLYVDAYSLLSRGITEEQLPDSCKLLSTSEVQSLLLDCEHLLSF